MTSPIDRLTTALTERLHYENVGNDSTLVRADDLDAVLAVVEAAQVFNGIANETMTVADKTWPERYDVARHALRAALAAIEGSKP